VKDIVKSASSRLVEWAKNDDFGSRHQEQEVLVEVAEATEVPADIMARLLRIEEEARFSAKRYRIKDKLMSALNSPWISTDEVLSERARRKLAEEQEGGYEDQLV
jgi:hypothetical protein